MATAESRGIPSLDGLRALSIGLVMLSHEPGTRWFPSSIPPFLLDHGQLGVHIFFLISGFLITTLLLREVRVTGRISLALFYGRRTLRIIPPLYAFLAIILLGKAVGAFEIPTHNFWYAAALLSNYNPAGIWITGHIWSLSVEEQFYLIWPLTILLAGFRRALWIAGAAAVLAPPAQFLLYVFWPAIGSTVGMQFPFVADSIAAGCLLAGIIDWLRGDPRVLRWLQAPAGDLVLPLMLLVDSARSHPRLHLAFVETFLNLCTCYALVRYTTFPGGPVGSLLNRKGIVFVGRVSYGLYLWQQIWINRFDRGLWASFPVNLGLAFGCAMLSWYAIELPLVQLRRRLRPDALQ